MSANAQPRLAWIGLGNMGRGMCKNLVEKGKLDSPLILYNRTRQRAEDLSAKLPRGSTVVAKDIAQVIANADIIFTCLGDDHAILDLFGYLVQNTDLANKMFVDCSTVHPETTNKVSEMLREECNVPFVASPVFGAPAMAESGQLVFVLAGPGKYIEMIKPYTTGVMGRAVIDYSNQEPGFATLLKVIGNTFILNMVETLSEGHVLAEKSGLGVENLQQFIETMFPGPYTAYSKRMSSGDYYKREEPLFGVDLARKDAKHAMDIAKAAGARLKAVEVADQHLSEVKRAKGSKGDIAGIYGAVRQESGLRFENQ
ncbi:MAG: hypothetical protein M4579_003738 [Chaenotheca gracillima]|nr:MAG: hypothetical protein M4579_003738 [Chaenotheca gracillima]